MWGSSVPPSVSPLWLEDPVCTPETVIQSAWHIQSLDSARLLTRGWNSWPLVLVLMMSFALWKLVPGNQIDTPGSFHTAQLIWSILFKHTVLHLGLDAKLDYIMRKAFIELWIRPKMVIIEGRLRYFRQKGKSLQYIAATATDRNTHGCGEKWVSK